jgi:hypothetical protein
MRLHGLSDRRALVLAALAYGTVLTWPVALARAALGFAFHDGASSTARAVDIVGDFAGLGAAVAVAVLCRRGPVGARPFVRGGGLGGLLSGGACFAVAELLRSSCETLLCRLKLAAGVTLMGGFWALPVAVPVGVLVGVTVWSMGKCLGVTDVPWWPERRALGGVAAVAMMTMQFVLGLWLRHALMAA